MEICKKYVFPFVKKNDSISLLRPNLNFDCIVAKEGRDVISVTLHIGVTSMERRRFPQKKWYQHERPQIPIHELLTHSFKV